VLAAAHLPAGHTTALSADGSDAGLDLADARAIGTAPTSGCCRVHPPNPALRPPLTFVTSEVPGLALKPATRGELTAWAHDGRRRFRAGDTVIVFVTDHGTRNPSDPKDNTITLWGDNQAISVNELRGAARRLRSGVRVDHGHVAVLFGLVREHGARRRGSGSAGVCGYFSTTADRLAYGCYPENRNRDHVGPRLSFLNALRQYR
jgi:hypothetical protein